MKYISFWILLGACEIFGIQLLDSKCVIKQFKRTITEEQKIFAPWMVSLHDGEEFICGGSLIAKAFVLTAAHCNCQTRKKLLARLGEHDLNRQKDCLVHLRCDNVYKVQLIYTHPKYTSYKFYDIAILKLEREVSYTEYIRPICLILQNNMEFWQRYMEKIKYLSAHGWGASQYSTLHEKHLTKIDRSTCRYPFNYTVNEAHICAGDRNQNVRLGDSGGPLGFMVTSNRFYYYVQLGIVSYGKNDKKMGVFTNVLSYANWIAEVITYDRKYMSPFLAKKKINN